MADEVRIGFIGTGGIANSHLKRLAEVDGAAPVAFCDVDIVRAEEKAKEYGSGEAYADYRRMLDKVKLDAVYICVPPHVHGDMEIDCAEKGLPMLVEKPVNLYLDEAKKIAGVIDSKGLVTAVGYSLRYAAVARQAKKFFDEHRISVAVCERWGGTPGTPWWKRYEMSGGQLVEMFTHQVDMLRWWMGEVETVSARYDWKHPDAEATVPGSQSILLGFESGATALMTCVCTLASYKSSISAVFGDAWASYGFKEGLEINSEKEYELPPLEEDPPNVDRAFVEAVVSGDPSGVLTPYGDGVKSLAATLAANESAQTGEVVKVADCVGHPRPE